MASGGPRKTVPSVTATSSGSPDAAPGQWSLTSQVPPGLELQVNHPDDADTQLPFASHFRLRGRSAWLYS